MILGKYSITVHFDMTCSLGKMKNIVKGILDLTKKDVIMDSYGSLTVLKFVICLLRNLWMMLLD